MRCATATAALLLGLLLAPASPAAAIQFLWVNDGDFGGTDNGDVLAYDTLTASNSVAVSQATLFGGEEVIDALSVLPNGHLVLSTENNASIGGFAFGDEELVDYDPVSGTAVSFLDMAPLFQANEDVDAVHVIDSDRILFSTNNSATLLASNGDLDFDDEDVVLYDRSTGAASLFLDGSAVLDGAEDVSAIFLTVSGRLVLSTETDASIGGAGFTDGELVKVDVATGTLQKSVVSLEGLPGTQDVRGLHVVAEPLTALLLTTALATLSTRGPRLA